MDRACTSPVGLMFFPAALALLWGTVAAAQTGVGDAQRRQVARYDKYFNAYKGKLLKGVLPPKSVGAVFGVKAGLGFIGKGEGGLLRVSDSHGMKHVVGRCTMGVCVAPGPIVMYHVGAVVGHTQAPGTDWHRLAPPVAGDLRGGVETAVGVGGGASTSLFVGAPPSVHHPRHEKKWNLAGEDHFYAAAGVSTGVTPLNFIGEANLTLNVPLWTSPGPLRKVVDKGLEVVSRAKTAVGGGDTTAAKTALQELGGLRKEVRMEAYRSGGLKRP